MIKKLIKWLERNLYEYEIHETVNKKPLIFIKVDVVTGTDTKVWKYIKRYIKPWTIEYAGHYTWLKVIM